jgi:hypothetical protein
VLLLLAACVPADKPTDTATPDPEAWREEPVTCDTPAVDATGAGTSWTVTTAHYTLEIEGFDEEEATNFGTLAETAWTGFASFFGAEVPGPLQVSVTADEAAFQDDLAADGITGVDGAGGYYDPGTERAYLFRQPTAYYNRVLLLHELTHQYQDHASFVSGLPTWYVEGVAEALGRHHWDGTCLQLRVRPLLSWEDMAAQAQAELDAGEPDVRGALEGGSPSRPLSQELVRLLTGDPSFADGFATWRAAVADGSAVATDVAAFEAAVAPVDDVTAALEAFVPEDQEPLAPIYLDWIPEGDDTAYGFSDVSAGARVKGEVTRFTMTVAAPTVGSVGSVYGYDDATGDLELALLSADGSVSRFAVIGGAVSWDDYGTAALVPTMDWEQEAGDATTTVTLGGTAVDLPRALPPAGGLALYGAEAHFAAIAWE